MVASEQRDRGALAHGAAGRAAHARPVRTPTSPTPSGCWATSWCPGPTSTPSRSRPTCAEPSAAPSPPSARARVAAACRVSRRFLLLVNPSAGGGRALDRLPAGGGRARRASAPTTARCRPRDIEHADDEARAAAGGGRDGGRDRRRRPAAPARRRRCATARSRWRSSRAGAATTSRACSASPSDPRRGGAASPSRASERLLDVAEVDGEPYLGIASFGFDSDANRIANEAQAGARQPRLPLRRAARAGLLEARRASR